MVLFEETIILYFQTRFSFTIIQNCMEHVPLHISGDNLDMEDEITVMYSTTDPTTEYSNTFSETTTNPTVEKYIFKWTDEIARMIQIIVRPILIIVGTFGNILTVNINEINITEGPI